MTNWSNEICKCGMRLLHSDEGYDLYCPECKEYYNDPNYNAENEAEKRFGA